MIIVKNIKYVQIDIREIIDIIFLITVIVSRKWVIYISIHRHALYSAYTFNERFRGKIRQKKKVI